MRTKGLTGCAFNSLGNLIDPGTRRVYFRVYIDNAIRVLWNSGITRRDLRKGAVYCEVNLNRQGLADCTVAIAYFSFSRLPFRLPPLPLSAIRNGMHCAVRISNRCLSRNGNFARARKSTMSYCRESFAGRARERRRNQFRPVTSCARVVQTMPHNYTSLSNARAPVVRNGLNSIAKCFISFSLSLSFFLLDFCLNLTDTIPSLHRSLIVLRNNKEQRSEKAPILRK